MNILSIFIKYIKEDLTYHIRKQLFMVLDSFFGSGQGYHIFESYTMEAYSHLLNGTNELISLVRHKNYL